MADKSYSFSVSDAQKWGSSDIATILHNIRFWLDKNKANNTHIHDGRVWTYNSAEAFSKLFPWLSSSQIKRLLKKLHDGGLLLKGNHSEDKLKKANWYSLDEPEYIVGELPLNQGENTENQAAAPVVVHSTESNDGLDGIERSIVRNRTMLHIENNKDTTTTEKLDFNAFAVSLISILQEMIAEGGWIPEGCPVPKKTWLKAKAQTLHNKFPDPRPEDCALIILKDWVKQTANTEALAQGAH